MKSIYISGNAPLYGEVTIQGSKNAALPIMAAALLIPGISVLKNCPRIADVEYTVSYTHLRAHETGRNLVCRLLLEKKKKKQKNKKEYKTEKKKNNK